MGMGLHGEMGVKKAIRRRSHRRIHSIARLLLCVAALPPSSCSSSSTPRYRPGSMRAVRKETGRVPVGEEARPYRRTIYAAADWRRHRRPGRLFSNIRSPLHSGVVRSVSQGVLAVTAVASFVVCWNAFIRAIAASNGRVNLMSECTMLRLPSILFNLSASPLGLLLVFRTNASYQRWVEARNCISGVVSKLRNILRLATVWGLETSSREQIAGLGQACWALMRTVQMHVRDPEQEYEVFREEVASQLSEQDVASLLMTGGENLPLWAMLNLSEKINDLPLQDAQRREIDKSLITIGECVTNCEKIYRSPVPLLYTRHAGRFLTVWLLTLPFALYDSFAISWKHAALIPACAVISMFLLGIDELSIQLEEPFSILPLEHSCNEVRDSTAMVLAWYDTQRQADVSS